MDKITRKDIAVSIETGDLVFKYSSPSQFQSFQWTENPIGESRYIYGEVNIPDFITEKQVRENGFFIKIPYTPVYKEIKIRIRRVRNDNTWVSVINQKDGSEWFVVNAAIYGLNPGNIYASELPIISNEAYYISMQRDSVTAYSANSTDFKIINADRQNANCLLSCVPSNNYRYPLSGVGIVRWINSSHIGSGNLAEVLEQEFSDDGMVVESAVYNYDTQSMDELRLHPNYVE